MEKITHKLITSLFNYRNDGKLIRKINRGNTKIGNVVGCMHHSGYLVTKINRKQYRCSRLIFLWHKGYLPENDVDHKDQNKTNDQIENLREVTKICNARNTGNPKNNKSGVKGVYWSKNNNTWNAFIGINMKSINLGNYKKFNDAVLSRLAAEYKTRWVNCNSNSPAYKYAKKHNLIQHDISATLDKYQLQDNNNLKNNTSGIKGVNQDKRTKKWRAFINRKKKHIHLGYYTNIDNAILARLSIEICSKLNLKNSTAYLYAKNHNLIHSERIY